MKLITISLWLRVCRQLVQLHMVTSKSEKTAKYKQIILVLEAASVYFLSQVCYFARTQVTYSHGLVIVGLTC